MRLLDVVTSPWAILPEKLEEIQAIYATHLRGEKIDIKAIEAKLGRPLENTEQGYDIVNGVAVVPMYGVMAKRMNMLSQISGGMSTQLAIRDLRAAASDPNVRGIVLDWDSPGGAVDGTPELAAVIASVSQQKPLVSFASGTMASAAYWAGSAATQVFISSGVNLIGSIGILARHMDVSRAEEARGVKTTLIYAGRYKALANEFAPLSEEGRADMQGRVDYLYAQFVGDVAKHRGVAVSTVIEQMADGRVFVGEQAIEAGLVDGASTLDDLIETLASGAAPAGKKKAAPKSTVTNQPDSSTGAVLEPSLKKEESEMDMTKLRADHPALVEALLKEGRDSVDANAFRIEGATAERTRITSIMAIGKTPGHDKTIAEAIADGKSTAGDVAQKILAADNAAREHKLEALKKDGAAAAAIKAGPANLPSADPEDKSLPVEERCKAAWDKDEKIRAEFTDLAAYTAFSRAQESGKVRVLGNKS